MSSKEAEAETSEDPTVAQAAEAVAAALAASVDTTAEDPNAPEDRDVILGEGAAGHKTNLLLQDIIRLHRILWKLHDKPIPTKPEEIEGLVQHVIDIMTNGKSFELAGLKDVPKPFMKSKGRFLAKENGVWKVLDDEEVKKSVTDIILEEFTVDDLGTMDETPFKDLKEWLSKYKDKKVEGAQDFLPETRDAILLRCADFGEKMYEQQGGNKNMFNLASQLVTSYTNSPDKRVEAALAIMKGLDDMDTDDSKDKDCTTTRLARFLLRVQSDDLTVTWETLNPATAAEFTVIFVFEVFLEKGIHISTGAAPTDTALMLPDTPADADYSRPSVSPVADPTEHDVLFGRGGMTNSHAGNRRFRDIIALHRPDYIRAIKMDKPGVARKIVKAIRFGNPPGRFMKKHDDGMWYDVGDRTAAEKTSQGLRERSNAEKRQRSALREALRIRKQDMVEDADSPAGKKAKTDGVAELSASITPTLNYIGTNLPVPLSLNMKPPEPKTVHRKKSANKDGKSGHETLNTEGLPPNAVDEEGNILVTDYDILCGRGGLTNHHIGNKRFRDIVALHRPDYVRAPKIQKPSVARVIVRAIRHGDPVGRFLRKDEKTGKWVDIGDKKAAEKTSQALREKTNEERDKLKANPAALGSGVLLPSPSSYLAAGLFPGIIPASTVPIAAAAADAADTGEKDGKADGGEEEEEEAKEEGRSDVAEAEAEAKTEEVEQTEEVELEQTEKVEQTEEV